MNVLDEQWVQLRCYMSHLAVPKRTRKAAGTYHGFPMGLSEWDFSREWRRVQENIICQWLTV